MVNEMGNNKSSQQANYGDDVRGSNRMNRVGEGKDLLHEEVEGLSSDKQPKGGDQPVAKRTTDDKEQDDTKLKLSSQSTEVLAIESSGEASQDSVIRPAASPAGSELLGSSITDDRQETEAKDEAENRFDNKYSEASSLGTSSNNIEEVLQTQDKSMPLSENKDKMDISEIENTEQAVNESNTDEVDSSQSGLVMDGSDSGNGEENVKNRELTETTPVMETVPTELPATECNNEEEEIIKEKVIEAIEKQEHDNGISPSAGNEAEVSGAVELRKLPSFDFDLSMEARPGEPVQTPLLHHNKNRTRSLSMFDGSNGVESLTQNEAVSVEEKTIEVARSDSDRSRASLLNFLKEEEGKGNVAVEPQKQDCEKKGVEESWTGTSKEVELTEESGKPKPRPSLLKKFLCCAAGTD